MSEHNSTLIHKTHCPKCRQSGGDSKGDNLGVFTDGHAFCFSCGYKKEGVQRPTVVAKAQAPLLTGIIPREGLPHRSLTQEVCQKFDYRIAQLSDKRIVQVAVYYRDGVPVAQKVRYPDKSFNCRGDMVSPPLFGQQLWRGGGRRVVITEGQIDAMSVYQATEGRVPVVSVPNGASGAAASIKDNLQWLNGYQQIVLCFDNDAAGQKAAKQCTMVLPPGKVLIASLPKKDANEMLKDSKVVELVAALNEAAPHRPDGVIHVSEVNPHKQQQQVIFQYPWDHMSSVLWGRRARELIIHTSGSGMGKTTLLRSLMDHDLKSGKKIGILMLQQSTQDSVNKLVGMRLGKPIHKILAMRKINTMRQKEGKKPLDFGVVDDLDDKMYADAVLEIKKQPLYLYDHFGSLQCSTLMSKMEYMRTTMGCDIIYLDHISIVISGTQSNNQRKDIDVLMTRLRQFVERSGCRVEAVCHLTKPQGLAYQQGATISLNDLRGSGSLSHLSDSVLGYQRNQQDQDKAKSNTIMVRSLKDRFSGYTGLVTALRYDQRTGRLNQVEFSTNEQGQVTFGFSSGDPSQIIPEQKLGEGII